MRDGGIFWPVSQLCGVYTLLDHAIQAYCDIYGTREMIMHEEREVPEVWDLVKDST